MTGALKVGKPKVPLKWFGGKVYLAPQIVAMMSPHTHYVEPFAGGCAVLLAYPGGGRSELINDLDGGLVNFWRVLRDPEKFGRFARMVGATPFAREEWEAARDSLDAADDVERAAAFFVHCRQSRAGERKCFSYPTRTRTRGGVNGNVNEWMGAVDGLPGFHARLRSVFVENMDAIDLMRREDTPGTLFYCDPPYVHATRANRDGYLHEMTDSHHAEFLAVAKSRAGKVMISGYACDLYDRELAGWNRREFDLPNNAAGGEAKRRMTEVVWCNF